MSSNTQHDAPPVLKLKATFSTYGCADSMQVEHWLYHGGNQPSDEVICKGFPVLYDQIIIIDFHGQLYWGGDQHFTESQKQRWELMESITQSKPVMKEYQAVNDIRRSFIAQYKGQQ